LLLQELLHLISSLLLQLLLSQHLLLRANHLLLFQTATSSLAAWFAP
jgi:hypothetical protein